MHLEDWKGPEEFLALYTDFGVPVVGIVGYRGLQLGTFDTVTGLIPYKTDKVSLGLPPRPEHHRLKSPSELQQRQRQMQSEKPPKEHLYKGTSDCFKKIAAEEGMAASTKVSWRVVQNQDANPRSEATRCRETLALQIVGCASSRSRA